MAKAEEGKRIPTKIRYLLILSVLVGTAFLFAHAAQGQSYPYCIGNCHAKDVQVSRVYIDNITRSGDVMSGDVRVDFSVTAANRYCITVAVDISTDENCSAPVTYYHSFGDLPQGPYNGELLGTITWPAGSGLWVCREFTVWRNQVSTNNCAEDCSTYQVNSKCWDGTGTAYPIIPTVEVIGDAVCEGETAAVSAVTNATNPQYEWTVPAGVPDPGNVASFTTTVAGDYRVKVTDLTTGGWNSNYGTVTVNPYPNCNITADDPVDAGSTGNHASVSNAGAGASYTWTLTGGIITAGQGTNAIIWTAGTGGTAHLSATVTSAAGCSTTCYRDVTIRPVAVLEIEKSASSDPVAAGDTLTYTIAVTNNGPSEASGVEVDDVLPTGMIYLSSNASQGSYDSGSGVWSVGTIQNGDSVTLEIEVQAGCPSGCNETVENTASVSATTHDPNSNNNSASVTITIEDTTAPTLTVPDNVTIECDASTDPADTGMATATDNCCSPDDIVISYTDQRDSSGCCGGGTITRTWSAEDACGNTATGVQIITIEDTTAPTLTVPDNVTIECDASTDPADTGMATATDNCCSPDDIVISYTDQRDSSGCCGGGTITRTWSAEDACGNTATGVQIITIEDTTAPVITVAAQNETVECDGQGNTADLNGWLGAHGGAQAEDACCADVTWTDDYDPQNFVAGNCAGTGHVDVTFTVSDGCGNSSTTSARFTIVDTTPPIAQDDSTTTAEDTPVMIDVLANDSDLCSPDLLIISVGTPGHGSAAIVNGEVKYTPDSNYNGLDRFPYTIEDCSGNQATATVTVAVAVVNDPPTANDDSYTTNEDTQLSVPAPGVLGNDTDPDGDPLTVTSYDHTTAQGGTVSMNPDGSFTYDPPADYCGPDSFGYTASDGNGGTDSATVTLTVTCVNDPPVAVNDSDTTSEDTPVTTNLVANDYDIDGTIVPSTVAILSGPANGSLTNNGNGTVTYTPDPNFNGTDTYTYMVDDNGGATSNVATVTITVNENPAGPIIDLSVEEIVSDPNPTVGENVVFTITLRNAPGFDGATGVKVTNTLGSGYDFVSNTQTLGIYNDTAGVWTIGALPAGMTARLEITATVKESGDYGNPVEVSAADQPDIDSTPANANSVHEDDDDSASVVVAAPSADLAITKSVNNPTPSEGEAVVFTITVVNNGPNAATGVIVTDSLPFGLDYVADDGFGAYSPVTDEWTIGDLAVGESTSLSITASVAAGTAGSTIVNIAGITGSDLDDPDTTNDRDQAEVTVGAPSSADLSVAKSVSNPTPNEGDPIIYTITVTNNGPDTATGVMISDLLPAGLTYAGDNGAGSYNSATGTWTVGTLAADSSTSLDITAQPDEGTGGSTLTNVASVSGSDQPDPNPGNDRDQVDIAVQAPPGGGGGALDECAGKVIINEVAWAGTAADPNDEWIELRNIGTAPVDLTGWVLRWRRKRPATVEDYQWKVVQLSGVLVGSGTSACELADTEQEPPAQFEKREIDDISWEVVANPPEDDGSYLLLERMSDDTVDDIKADIVYDTTKPYQLDLPDEGAVIELLDADGRVVDTANAFKPIQDGWPAGDQVTHATMERTNPLGPDKPWNWHTNIGIVTRGEDERRQPLVATAETINSPSLDELTLFAELDPTKTIAGARLEVGLDLTPDERRVYGWPWIRVTRPASEEAGGGGAVAPEEESYYSFASRYANDLYWLAIDTSGFAPGDYLVWIVYGPGRVILVPITVLQ